jgi:hypothetical protein
MKKPDKADVLILLGLTNLGAGLYMWLGEGIAMSIIGTLILILGIVEELKPNG